jgi:hypothetical protein
MLCVPLQEDDEDSMPRASPFAWSRVRQEAQVRCLAPAGAGD